MLVDSLAQCFARCFDRDVTLAHRLRREIGVCASAIPVTLLRLGIERYDDVVVLSNALHQPTRDDEVVAHRDRVGSADLVFPLPRHHFGIGSFDHQASFDARERVVLDDLATHHAARTDAAVVRTLRSRLTALLRKSEWAAVQTHERVLLLDAEDHLVGGVLLGRLDERGTRVGGVWSTRRGEHHFAQHEDVLAATDRVLAGEHGLEHAVGLVARRLFGGGAVESPDRRSLHAVLQDLRLGAQHGGGLMSVDPDVFGLIRHGVPLVSSGLVRVRSIEVKILAFRSFSAVARL